MSEYIYVVLSLSSLSCMRPSIADTKMIHHSLRTFFGIDAVSIIHKCPLTRMHTHCTKPHAQSVSLGHTSTSRLPTCRLFFVW